MEMEDYIYDQYDYNDSSDGGDYEPSDDRTFQPDAAMSLKAVKHTTVVVVSVVIFLLGFSGNALVIWISGFKMKKTVNTTWYLSLAVSDFVFCSFLPFNIANTIMGHWVFGRFMCKFVPFLLFLNMFSSIFLLVVISMDRCVSVMFPVWAQNQRTVTKAAVVVVAAWVLAGAVSVPSIVFRELNQRAEGAVCFNNYTSNRLSHEVIAVSRTVVGFVVPFTVIILCYSIIFFKLRSSRMAKSSKPFKVMTALIVTFFACWLPYHVFILLELNHHRYDHDVLTDGLKAGTCMAAANSFLNPVLYVFMGKDFKKSLKGTLVSRLKSAIGEEAPTISRYLSRSSSMDGRASTHI